MFIVYRFIYHTTKRIAHWAYGLSHAFGWLAYKAYGKCEFGKHQRTGK